MALSFLINFEKIVNGTDGITTPSLLFLQSLLDQECTVASGSEAKSSKTDESKDKEKQGEDSVTATSAAKDQTGKTGTASGTKVAAQGWGSEKIGGLPPQNARGALDKARAQVRPRSSDIQAGPKARGTRPSSGYMTELLAAPRGDSLYVERWLEKLYFRHALVLVPEDENKKGGDNREGQNIVAGVDGLRKLSAASRGDRATSEPGTLRSGQPPANSRYQQVPAFKLLPPRPMSRAGSRTLRAVFPGNTVNSQPSANTGSNHNSSTDNNASQGLIVTTMAERVRAEILRERLLSTLQRTNLHNMPQR